MVQVDVFWSYAIGSSFALAAFRQLRKLEAESGKNCDFDLKDALDPRKLAKEIEKGDSPAFSNQYFLKTLLFLALLFVPSGANLLWSNPNWETMQAGSYENIPGWLVGAFTITNVTQGIAGYRVTYSLLMKGRYYRAALQTLMAYLGFWFILVNGWDKTGYQRFFSRNRDAFESWSWKNIGGWLTSDVVRILLAYGAAFIPLMLFWLSRWLMEGYEMDEEVEAPWTAEERRAELARINADFLTVVFGQALGSAIVAHLLVRRLGWVKGLAAFAAIFYGAVLKGTAPVLLKRLLKVDSLDGPPVWELDG